MSVDYNNQLHDDGRERGLSSARTVARMVYEVFRPDSVLDVGCGFGYWLRAFQDLGAKRVAGIDGDYIDRSKLEIDPACFHPMDINQPIRPLGSFDLAMTIEVAEHLQPSTSDRFVDYLCAASKVVLFSAGIPGQPGHRHINARWPYDWAARFARRGYTALDFIRPRIWHDESMMLCHRQNLHLYVHESLLVRPEVQALPRMNCLTLVDFDTLQELLGVRASLRRILGRLTGRGRD